MKDIKRFDLDSIRPYGPNGRFQRVKKRLRSVHLLIQGGKLSNEQINSLIGLILTSGDFRKEYKAILGIDEAAEKRSSRVSGTLSRFGDWFLSKDPNEARKAHHEFFDLPPLSDRDYLIFLRQLKADQPAFREVIDQILVMAHQHIADVLSNALRSQLPFRLQHDMNEREEQDLKARRKKITEEEEAHSWGALKDQVIQDLEDSNEQYA